MTDDSIGPDELDAIEERSAKATPGPWADDGAPNGRRHVVDDNGNHVARLTAVIEGSSLPWDEASMREEDNVQDMADADFIASARSDVPRLVARVRELEADIDHLRSQAGPDSCVDMVRQRDAASARAAQWKAKYEGLLIAMSPDQEAHATAIARAERAEAAAGQMRAALLAMGEVAEVAGMARGDQFTQEWRDKLVAARGLLLTTLAADVGKGYVSPEAHAAVVAERDEAQLCASCDKPPAVLCRSCAAREFSDLRAQLEAVTAERDEARAQVVALDVADGNCSADALRLLARVRVLEEVATAARLLADSMGLVNPLAPWGRLRDALVSALAKLDALRTPGGGQ